MCLASFRVTKTTNDVAIFDMLKSARETFLSLENNRKIFGDFSKIYRLHPQNELNQMLSFLIFIHSDYSLAVNVVLFSHLSDWHSKPSTFTKEKQSCS